MSRWAENKGYEFGLSVVHNGAYYEKEDNEIVKKTELAEEMDKLMKELLRSKRPKNWFRAFFTCGEKKYIFCEKKPFHCDAGKDSFFVDYNGDVIPCNGMPGKLVMGNLKRQTWKEIMDSKEAAGIRDICRKCSLNCWSICNINATMWRKIYIPILWIIKHKGKK